MKKIFLALLFILLVPTLSFAMPNEPEGFNNIKLGTHINDIKKEHELILFLEKEKGKPYETYTYNIKNDKTKFEEITISEITYSFYKNRLFYISLFIDEIDNNPEKFNNIINNFYQKYGTPDEIDYGKNGKKQHYWSGKNTDITIYEHKDNEKTITVAMTDIKLFTDYTLTIHKKP